VFCRRDWTESQVVTRRPMSGHGHSTRSSEIRHITNVSSPKSNPFRPECPISNSPTTCHSSKRRSSNAFASTPPSLVRCFNPPPAKTSLCQTVRSSEMGTSYCGLLGCRLACPPFSATMSSRSDPRDGWRGVLASRMLYASPIFHDGPKRCVGQQMANGAGGCVQGVTAAVRF